MINHPAIDDLKRWRRGEAGEDEMIAIADHLSTCHECVADRAPLLGLGRAAAGLCDELEGAEEHPDVESDLFPFVDGTATAGQRLRIEEHLELCAFCKGSVADLRKLAAEKRPRQLRPWLLALAASAVLAVRNMRMSRLLSIAVLSVMAVVSSGAARTVIPVRPFRSVELHDGGNVIVRHGPTQRVTILMGDSRYTRVRVDGAQRLVIERCQPECPSDYRQQIEVITPAISAVSVSNGGTVQSAGAFPAQATIAAAVEQGGTIDIRSIPADAVDASVDSGGRIFATSRETLTASILSGGGITYWGDPRVKRTVRNGGALARGTRADADKPLSEFNPPLAPIPPIPPVPPIPPLSDH